MATKSNEFPVGGTTTEPITPEQEAAVDTIIEQMMPALAKAAAFAALDLVQRARCGKDDLDKIGAQFSLSGAAQENIAVNLRELVAKKARDNAVLPYQHCLSEELKQQIDCGEMDLINYCNSHHGELMIPDSYFGEGTMDSCKVAINGFLPLQLRKLKARISNTTMYQVRGTDARYMGLETLWNAISPPKGGRRAQVTMSRFSLPTAIMTLRLSATKSVPSLFDYFYYDHPENCLFTTTDGSTNKSGMAFVGVKKLAEALNSMIFRHHGAPEEGTKQWSEASKHFIQPATVQAVIGALARITHADEDRARDQARLFFTSAPAPPWRNQAGLSTLIQPICTIDSNEVLTQRQELYERLVSGKLTKDLDQASLPVLADPATPPQVANPVHEPTLLVLGHPASYKWEKPGDQRPQPVDPGGANWRNTSASKGPTRGPAKQPRTNSTRWTAPASGCPNNRKRDSHLWRMKH